MKNQNESRLPALEMPVNPPVSELEVVAPNIGLLVASIAIVVFATSF